MLGSKFRFLSSVEAETPNGLYGWAKGLVETFQAWRLTDLIDQPLLGNEGKFIRVKDDASGYEHGAGTKAVIANSNYTEETTSGDVVIFGTGPIEIGLPTAVGNKAAFHIKAIQGSLIISADGTETIDGFMVDVNLPFGSTTTLRSDGANWWTF